MMGSKIHPYYCDQLPVERFDPPLLWELSNVAEISGFVRFKGTLKVVASVDYIVTIKLNVCLCVCVCVLLLCCLLFLLVFAEYLNLSTSFASLSTAFSVKM